MLIVHGTDNFTALTTQATNENLADATAERDSLATQLTALQATVPESTVLSKPKEANKVATDDHDPSALVEQHAFHVRELSMVNRKHSTALAELQTQLRRATEEKQMLEAKLHAVSLGVPVSGLGGGEASTT